MQYKRLFTFFLLALLILFFVSPNSYTHDLYDQYDTAWFFTCGKAWMNGMIPYVDFSDSKGPLLWLIYGLGYLLSPCDYIGVFWLSVILYTGVFYYVYAIANIFLKNNSKAFLTTIIMLLSFFCPWFHYEVRAEDWCQIFIIMTIYHCCRWFYLDEIDKEKECYYACFSLGFCFAGTLLIKFSVAAMFGVPAFYMFFAIIKQRINVYISFIKFLSGFSILFLPFLIYMLSVGNFNAFLQEYFYNTMQTVQTTNTLGMYMHELLKLTYDARFIVLFVLSCFGTYMTGRMMKNNRFFLLITFLGFYCVAIHHCFDNNPYYLCVCLIFPLFFVIPFIAKYEFPINYRRFVFVVVFSVTVFVNAFSYGWLLSVWFFRDNGARMDYYNVAYIMSEVKYPKVVNYMASEYGRGVPAGVLPGAKYWAYQVGATDEMKNNQEESIKEKIPDFVFVNECLPGVNERDSLVKSYGYLPIYKYKWLDINFTLYSKHHNLQMPPANFHVSNTDVLLKRNIFK